jgi:hypothetical protein
MKASHILRASNSLFKPKNSIQLEKIKFDVLPSQFRSECKDVIEKVARQNICPIKDAAVTHRHKTETIYIIYDFITRDLFNARHEERVKHSAGLNKMIGAISTLSYAHSLVFTIARQLERFHNFSATTSIKNIEEHLDLLDGTFTFTHQEKVKECKKLLKEQGLPIFSELFEFAGKYPVLHNCLKDYNKDLDSLRKDLSEAIELDRELNQGRDLD